MRAYRLVDGVMCGWYVNESCLKINLYVQAHAYKRAMLMPRPYIKGYPRLENYGRLRE